MWCKLCNSRLVSFGTDFCNGCHLKSKACEVCHLYFLPKIMYEYGALGLRRCTGCIESVIRMCIVCDKLYYGYLDQLKYNRCRRCETIHTDVFNKTIPKKYIQYNLDVFYNVVHSGSGKKTNESKIHDAVVGIKVVNVNGKKYLNKLINLYQINSTECNEHLGCVKIYNIVSSTLFKSKNKSGPVSTKIYKVQK